jgi:copper oxidase (laccase) domain-containing protein
LDVAGGTGDLTIGLARQVGRSGHVVLSDINAAMLFRGRERLLDAGIASNVIRRMGEVGARPDRVRVALGPSIGPCCFEVGPEVVAEFRAAFGEVAGLVVRGPHKDHIDLRVASRAVLEQRRGACRASAITAVYTLRGRAVLQLPSRRQDGGVHGIHQVT